MESLKDKVVIVTGSTAGIGEATVILFAKHGSKVVITGRNKERAEAVSRRCEDLSPNKYKNLVMVGDIRDESFKEDLIKNTIKFYGNIDVLVNNAGSMIRCNIMSDEFMNHYEAIMNLNLRSPLVLSRLALPYLIHSKGCIVNVSSIASVRHVMDDCLSSHMSKSALDSMTRLLAHEFGPKGVRVVSINSGITKTTLHEKLSLPEEMYDVIGKDIPLRRAAHADEMASIICFMASSGASFVTGTSVTVDGGHTTT